MRARKINPVAHGLFFLIHLPVLAGIWFVGFVYLGVIGHFESCPWYIDVLLVLALLVSFRYPHGLLYPQFFAAIFAATAFQYYSKVYYLLWAVFAIWAVAWVTSIVIIHRIRSCMYVINGFNIFIRE